MLADHATLLTHPLWGRLSLREPCCSRVSHSLTVWSEWPVAMVCPARETEMHRAAFCPLSWAEGAQTSTFHSLTLPSSEEL